MLFQNYKQPHEVDPAMLKTKKQKTTEAEGTTSQKATSGSQTPSRNNNSLQTAIKTPTQGSISIVKARKKRKSIITSSYKAPPTKVCICIIFIMSKHMLFTFSFVRLYKKNVNVWKISCTQLKDGKILINYMILNLIFHTYLQGVERGIRNQLQQVLCQWLY